MALGSGTLRRDPGETIAGFQAEALRRSSGGAQTERHEGYSSPIAGSELDLSKDLVSLYRKRDFETCNSRIKDALLQMRRLPVDPDPYLYLNLIIASKIEPKIFREPPLLASLLQVLSRDFGHTSRGHTSLQVLVCNILLNAYRSTDTWPIEFVQLLLDDWFGERAWVDEPLNASFVDNILSILPGAVSLFRPESIQYTVPIANRYFGPRPWNLFQEFSMTHIQQALGQGGENTKRAIRLLTLLALHYPAARFLAVSHLEHWLSQPALLGTTAV